MSFENHSIPFDFSGENASGPSVDRSLTVWKFGGTSMAHPATYQRLAAILAGPRDGRLLIVCSAVAGVTDTLAEILDTSADDVTGLFSRLEKLHLHLIDAVFPKSLRSLAIERVQRWLNLQAALLAHRGHRYEGQTDAAFRDQFLAGGERLSSALLTLFLSKAAPVTCLDARKVLVSDERHGDAEVNLAASTHHAERFLIPLLNRQRAVITQGFVAATPDGETTTLGRGGSDTSATLFARLLRADSVTIWTDTPGVMSTDPRLVANAQTLPALTYAEAGALAHHGAKVLHPSSMRPLQSVGIPVTVLNSFAPDEPGTAISHSADQPRFAISLLPQQCLVRFRTEAGPAFSRLSERLRNLPARFWSRVTAFDVAMRETKVLLRREDASWLANVSDPLSADWIDGVSLLFVLQRDRGTDTVASDEAARWLAQAGLTPLFAAPAVPVSDFFIAVPADQVKAAVQHLHRPLASNASHNISSPIASEVCP